MARRASGLNQSISEPPAAAGGTVVERYSAGHRLDSEARADLAQPRDHAVGVRPVADDVAEVPDAIDRAGVGKDRIEGRQVRVDVREDRNPHAGRD
jgi:hypothetical protein